MLSVCQSTANKLHLRCKKGGKYDNWRGLSEEERKRLKKSEKMECSYIIRVTKSTSEGFHYSSMKNFERVHNHPITESNLLATNAGRMRNLTPAEVKKVEESIEQRVPTKLIQTMLSSSSEFNKLTVHDINNWKYLRNKKVDINSAEGATLLLKYIGSKGYLTSFRKTPESDILDGLFITNNTLVERARMFPEVVVIDATYVTNDLKMPLICTYGVSNLGGSVLKTFPIAFAWVANEREDMYDWFLETLSTTVGPSMKKTCFVTDKCAALMNQLEHHFPANKTLLCTWHMMNNLDNKCTTKFFQNTDFCKTFKTTVNNMMHCHTNAEYISLEQNLAFMLNNSENFVDKFQQESFQRYYKNEWEKHVEKWAGHFTSKVKHFGCTTTQRAESGHNMMKRGMSAVQPLDRAFDCLDQNIMQFERGYNELKLKERSSIDVLVLSEPRLKRLFGKVSHRFLIATREELRREAVSDECDCFNPIVHDIPCCHTLKKLSRQELKVKDVPARWIIDSQEAADTSSVSCKVKPWMRCVLAIERAFRSFEDDDSKVNQLINSLEDVLHSASNDQTDIPADTSVIPPVRLPRTTEVKFPGRPMNHMRFPTSKKDFIKADFRKQLMLYNKRFAVRTAAKVEGLEEKADIQKRVLLEDKIGISILAKNNTLVLPQKRYRSDTLFMPEKRKKKDDIRKKDGDSTIDLSEDLYKPKKVRQRHLNESDLPCALNLAINIENVKQVYNPKSNGYCGYRAIAFIHYGNEEEYLKVKSDMLKALRENKEVYENKLAFDVSLLKDNIEREMESKSKICQWFNTPDCAQVVADAYHVPVCIYSDPQYPNIPSLTYLPLKRLIEKPKFKIRTCCNRLQVEK